MNWKNIIERAAWTFVEGFLVALPAGAQLGTDWNAWKAALFAAAMAGLSAVKTMIVEIIRDKE